MGGLKDLASGVLGTLGEAVKGTGGVVETVTSTGVGVVRNALKEAAGAGVGLADSLGDVAEAIIENVRGVGGSLEDAAVETVKQTIDAAGEIGESTTENAGKVATALVKEATKISAEAGAGVRNVLVGTISGVTVVVAD